GAIVRTPRGETITLLNPQIIDNFGEQDEQYEGCLSFFDVRDTVPRPLAIQVVHQHTDGSTHITTFERGIARLIAHEIDHLAGVLYTDRMAKDASVIPVEQYRSGGQSWQYTRPLIQRTDQAGQVLCCVGGDMARSGEQLLDHSRAGR